MAGRGRGGFRGGRGGAAANPFAGDMGTLTHQDIKEVMGKSKGELFPDLDARSIAYLKPITEREKRILKWTSINEDMLRENSDWTLTLPKKEHITIEIETYSDKYKPKTALASESAASGPLDPTRLHMYKELFPKGLWKMYFEHVKPDIKKTKKKKAVLDSDDDMPGKDDDDDNDDKSQSGSSIADEDFDQDDSDLDYDANYFDNGEGDGSDGDGGDDDGDGGGDD